ncbi:flagellar export protein FliJ [Chromobacterium alkanivorans]|uniref:flagellar export protein FliJ n=1 Tax=Chromobacterium alkanivorans TaxID=1071719 RepID=UPI00196866EB|nr:flagellar export protein FliJ [Chromobacterium alkanivorans]MBN3005474.1 flagellar export protein FliJ [Chromobacterium alkanivorans]
MSQPEDVRRLGLMVQLRQQDVDRLQSEVEGKRQLQERYRRNIVRMGELCGQSGASADAGHPALARNCADYKGALLGLMASQQQDLQLAEADAAVSQRALLQASLRREVMVQVRDQAAESLLRLRLKKEQKQTDELAGQAWLRGA